MSMFPDTTRRPLDYGHADTGESTRRSFFNQVYLWMAVGLIITASVSAGVAMTPLSKVLYGSGFGVISLIVMFLGLMVIGWSFNKAVFTMSLTTATLLYALYCSLMGALISYVWLMYDIRTLGAAFILTGGIFGVMSVLGYTTKIDLSKMGAILLMGVLGVFLASIVNLFIASNALSWILTYVSVGLFVGLIAYFTQDLKEKADTYGNDPVLGPKFALIGSFELYWAFINLFLNLLRILGDRR